MTKNEDAAEVAAVVTIDRLFDNERATEMITICAEYETHLGEINDKPNT